MSNLLSRALRRKEARRIAKSGNVKDAIKELGERDYNMIKTQVNDFYHSEAHNIANSVVEDWLRYLCGFLHFGMNHRVVWVNDFMTRYFDYMYQMRVDGTTAKDVDALLKDDGFDFGKLTESLNARLDEEEKSHAETARMIKERGILE